MPDPLIPLIIEGVDITHSRLVDLTRLADQAEAFYDWVTVQFQRTLERSDSLDSILRTASEEEIRAGITVCYEAAGGPNLPILFDGVGRSYPHAKGCYYFFAWLIRDAPTQRLGPLIQRMVRRSRRARVEMEIHALAALIRKYRNNVKTFSWMAIREIVLDRLEGSRRSIRGHEKEAVVRTALITAIQSYYTQHGNYGIYAGIEIPTGQITIGNETFDVSANLLNDERQCVRRILVPIKTRETEGGGHAHLFSRDITSAINAARLDNSEDHLVAVIVARNWSDREAQSIRKKVDHAAIFDLSPNDFSAFSDEEQARLNGFIVTVFSHD
jgi:hypothetical protein